MVEIAVLGVPSQNLDGKVGIASASWVLKKSRCRWQWTVVGLGVKAGDVGQLQGEGERRGWGS